MRASKGLEQKNIIGAQVRWGKAFCVLLAVMAALTVISRAAASFTVARVIVETPTSQRIRHIVTADGVVSANREKAILTCPDLVVDAVLVNVGQEVHAGDVLARLQEESLSEHIRALEDEITVARLERQAMQEAERLQGMQQEKQKNRAQADFEDAVQRNEALVEQARQRLVFAQTCLEQAQAAEDYQENIPELQAAWQEAQAAYQAALAQQAAEIKQAQRDLEDAVVEAAKEYGQQTNAILISAKSEELKKLKTLAEQQGEIRCTTEGVVTKIWIEPGQKTADTAAFLLADTTEGVCFTAVVPGNQAEYVANGDTVSLTASGRDYAGLSVTSLKTTDEGDVEVTVAVMESGLSVGEHATVKIEKTSQNYAVTIPVGAMHVENGRYYVFVMEEEDTVLGGSYAARRVDVEPQEQNNAYVALKEGALTADSRVITEATAFLQAGDRVRLQSP